ncbi:hypothetical protein TYRP_016732 [Tyrophagus putrescentiae]|nr:hypothetical protein TYRP_016732 [Tyrophagus putrescentiae]
MSPVQRLTASTVSVNLSTTECDGFVWRPEVFVTATGICGKRCNFSKDGNSKNVFRGNVKQRLTLTSLGSPKTPADSDLARSAREALVGGRFCITFPPF